MLKLTASSKERTPHNPIYNHGANTIPISCKKYHDSNDLTNSSGGDTANHKTSQSISKLTVATSLDDEIPEQQLVSMQAADHPVQLPP